MKEKKPAYALKMATASMTGDIKTVEKVAFTCVSDMTEELTALLGRYHPADLPMFVLAMRLLDKGLDPVLNDSARSLIQYMTSRTSCITVDAREFMRQAMEQKDEDEK